MIETEECSGASAQRLSVALSRYVASPSRAQHLHELLGGYCHECRNHLNSLKISMYLACRGSDAGSAVVWKDAEQRYQKVEDFIDRMQLIIRPMPLNLVTLPLNLLMEERKESWTGALAESGMRLILEPPDRPAEVAFDPARLGQAFDDLVAWRSRTADPSNDLRVRWGVQTGRVRVSWDEPFRGSAKAKCAPTRAPAGSHLEALTVPLLTRVVSQHGGRMEVGTSGKWHVSLEWPIDARPTS